MPKKIVFVIGAGASTEVNLPDGNKLKKEISNLYGAESNQNKIIQARIDNCIIDTLRYYSKNKNKSKTGDIRLFLSEMLKLVKALNYAISIDNLIDDHQDNSPLVLCGKLAIVRAILKAEHNSFLQIKQNVVKPYFEKQGKLDGTWYIPFFKLIKQGCTKAEIKERFKHITLIIFNYDRCIEHFLYYALQHYYMISESEAVEIINSMNIYHPYGTVGSLPWNTGKDAIEFGGDPHEMQMLQLVDKIKTFTEGTDPDSSDISEIHNHMNTANIVAFLGFAFHKQNMKLITPPHLQKSRTINCYATVKGISESNQNIIAARIEDLYNSSETYVKIKDLTCTDFFSEYWEHLAFS